MSYSEDLPGNDEDTLSSHGSPSITHKRALDITEQLPGFASESYENIDRDELVFGGIGQEPPVTNANLTSWELSDFNNYQLSNALHGDKNSKHAYTSNLPINQHENPEDYDLSTEHGPNTVKHEQQDIAGLQILHDSHYGSDLDIPHDFHQAGLDNTPAQHGWQQDFQASASHLPPEKPYPSPDTASAPVDPYCSILPQQDNGNEPRSSSIQYGFEVPVSTSAPPNNHYPSHLAPPYTTDDAASLGALFNKTYGRAKLAVNYSEDSDIQNHGFENSLLNQLPHLAIHQPFGQTISAASNPEHNLDDLTTRQPIGHIQICQDAIPQSMVAMQSTSSQAMFNLIQLNHRTSQAQQRGSMDFPRVSRYPSERSDRQRSLASAFKFPAGLDSHSRAVEGQDPPAITQCEQAPPQSANSRGHQGYLNETADGDGHVGQILSETDLYAALAEHRRKEWVKSDYPQDNPEAQMAWVKQIIIAFRNVDGCLDNQKVLDTYNAAYADRQIEIAAWQIMVCGPDCVY